jgi:hypothetical protein
VSLIKISRNKRGALELTGRAWQEDGTPSGRYWSEAVKEKEDGSGIFWYVELIAERLRNWKSMKSA